jgi:RHS repeat-associated protein
VSRPDLSPQPARAGKLRQRRGAERAAANVRKLGYGYDVFGNVKRQSLNDGASREDYAYDELQRMVSAIRSGAASGSISYGYDSVGNLTKKTDFSANTENAYSYTGGSCGGGANAVRSVALAGGGARTYCYDANGSLISDNAGLALQYDHQGMTVKATRGAQTDHFRYGPDGARTRSWGSDGARVYLPGYEHRTDTGETKVYVGDYAVISKTGATRKVDYLLKDRLGSVDAVTDSAGTVTETRGYDAFGKPRSGTWNDLTPPKLGSVAITPKGFTQHEHLNQLELIHMNGRVFDYALGRFFSVDPIIQFPLNSQSLNPYSYILNNPLSGTDPTGYEVCSGDEKNNCTDVEVRKVAPLGSRITSSTQIVGQVSNGQVTANINITINKDGTVVSGGITLSNGANRDQSGKSGSRDTSSAGGPSSREQVQKASVGLVGAAAPVSGEAASGGVASRLAGGLLAFLTPAVAATAAGVIGLVVPKPTSAEANLTPSEAMSYALDKAWDAGISRATELTRRAGSDGKAMIGENRNRVIQAAKWYGANSIRFPLEYSFKQPISAEQKIVSLVFNAAWINGVMNDGLQILDIGRDPRRVAAGQDPSEWYMLERAMIKLRNYPKHSQVAGPESLGGE